MQSLMTILAVTLAMLQVPETVRQAQTGTASGVVRSTTGEAAAGVRVAAVALPNGETGAGEGALVSLTQTDSAGRYRLDNILPGRYYIQAGLLDVPTYYPGVNTTARATSIQIAAGAAVDGLNFTLSSGSVGVRVAGRVPITPSRPTLIRIMGGTATFRTTTAQVQPDGSFEFLRVTPGSYTLAATPANSLPNLPIVVGDTDLDVGIPAGPGVRVSGTVGLGPRSPRPPGQKVVLAGASAWAQLESTLSADGAFSIANVPPGTYGLKTIPGSPSSLGTVVVADRDITGIRLAGYVEVAGTMVIQDGSQLPSTSTAVMLEAKPVRGSAFATAIHADGAFRLPLPEGEYQIAVGKLPAGLFVKSIFYDSTDLRTGPLKLDGSADLSSIRVVLESR